MKPGEALQELTHLGYQFELDGGDLHYWFEGSATPDPQRVEPLFEVIRENKAETLVILAILGMNASCFECSHFLPGGGPNPTEAWGRCDRLARGSYGCALTCEHFTRGRDKPERKPAPPGDEPECPPKLGTCKGIGCRAPALDVGEDGKPRCWACLAAERLFEVSQVGVDPGRDRQIHK